MASQGSFHVAKTPLADRMMPARHKRLELLFERGWEDEIAYVRRARAVAILLGI
jgi:hypothetical protein